MEHSSVPHHQNEYNQLSEISRLLARVKPDCLVRGSHQYVYHTSDGKKKKKREKKRRKKITIPVVMLFLKPTAELGRKLLTILLY